MESLVDDDRGGVSGVQPLLPDESPPAEGHRRSARDGPGKHDARLAEGPAIAVRNDERRQVLDRRPALLLEASGESLARAIPELREEADARVSRQSLRRVPESREHDVFECHVASSLETQACSIVAEPGPRERRPGYHHQREPDSRALPSPPPLPFLPAAPHEPSDALVGPAS